MKVVRELKVKNRLGLHTRPATVIVKILQNSLSDVQFTYKKKSVNAKSILSLLMLAARKNAKITASLEGEDAEEIMERLVEAFENEFGE